MQLRQRYSSTIGLAIFPWREPQNSGVRADLTGDQANAYKTAKDAAKAGLKNPYCQDFLKKHGINPNELTGALTKLKAYDGTRSTISIADAGLYPNGEPLSSQSVQDHFNDPDLDIYAETAIRGGAKTRYDVYFGKHPITASTLLVEAMHSATLLDDFDLAFRASKLNLSPERGKTPSEQIDNALRANKCTN